MVELWIRPIKYDFRSEKLFPLLLAKFEPPLADAIEESESIALRLSLYSPDYYFDVEVLGRARNGEWTRFMGGRKEVMRGGETQ